MIEHIKKTREHHSHHDSASELADDLAQILQDELKSFKRYLVPFIKDLNSYHGYSLNIAHLRFVQFRWRKRLMGVEFVIPTA